jgi:hypothetical protein
LRIASLLPPAISAISVSSDATVVADVPAAKTAPVDAVGVTPIVIEASRFLEAEITDLREERL